MPRRRRKKRPRPPKLSTSWKHRFWALLHTRALRFRIADTGNRKAETVFLAEFTRRIPCGNCRRHWKETLAAFPPDLTSGPAYFAWTVRAHNEINRLLGKRRVTAAAARVIWRQVTELTHA